MSFMNRIGNQFENLGLGNKKFGGSQQQPQHPQYYPSPPIPQQPSSDVNQGMPSQSQYYPPVSQGSQPPYHTLSSPDRPTLPLGWTTLYDQQQQRWYYVEQSTNRTQWEVPTIHSPSPAPAPPPPPAVSYDSRPYDGARGMSPPASQTNAVGPPGYAPQPPIMTSQGPGGYSSQGQETRYPSAQPGFYSPQPPSQPLSSPPPAFGAPSPGPAGPAAKKDRKGGMLLGAAGGLAAGAVGGALIGEALNRHEEKEEAYEEDFGGGGQGYDDEDQDDY